MYSVVLMAALTTGSNVPAWGCWGCHGGILGCHGCYGGGGCWGGGCRGGGCWGGCRGGYGGYACNGCYGGGCYGCYGASGGCYGWTGGCQGCYGGWGGSNYAPTRRPPVDKLPPPKKPEDKKTSADNQARVIVELPGDAKLYVDDQLMKSTSQRRVFKTPSLAQGETYYYILRAEAVRDRQKRSENKQVLVQAGQEVRVSFPELEGLATTRAEAGKKH